MTAFNHPGVFPIPRQGPARLIERALAFQSDEAFALFWHGHCANQIPFRRCLPTARRPDLGFIPRGSAASSTDEVATTANGTRLAQTRIEGFREAATALETNCIASHLFGRTVMLRLALIFLVVALIAGALGLFRTEMVAAEVAWVLFVVFLIMAVVSMVVGRRAGPPI
jgi:uncharacterized membrane protein YtjA (UPF0391 family)